MINFIALLGWSPHSAVVTSEPSSSSTKEEDTRTANQFNPQELFSLKELVEQFSLDGLNKRPVTLGKKLLWMNKQHFKRKLKNSKDLRELACKLKEELECHSNLFSRLVLYHK